MPAGFTLERSLPVWTTDHRDLDRARRLDRVEHHVRTPDGTPAVIYTDRTGKPLSAWRTPPGAADDAIHTAHDADGELRVLDIPWLMRKLLWQHAADHDVLTVLHAADPALVGKRFSRGEFQEHLRHAKTVRGIKLAAPSAH